MLTRFFFSKTTEANRWPQPYHRNCCDASKVFTRPKPQLNGMDSIISGYWITSIKSNKSEGAVCHASSYESSKTRQCRSSFFNFFLTSETQLRHWGSNSTFSSHWQERQLARLGGYSGHAGSVSRWTRARSTAASRVNKVVTSCLYV